MANRFAAFEDADEQAEVQKAPPKKVQAQAQAKV
jgi:hypothetical protein